MIMAGGSGTRLWPMSRQDRPKQLIPFVGGQSLLELAFGRLDDIVPLDQRWICTAEKHREAVLERLPIDSGRVLGEPVARDTLNAVGFAAAVLAAQDPDAIFAVFTADHIIEPQDEFKRKVNVGFELVEQDPARFVTFSIMPTRPATGYGYVQRGAEIDGFAAAYVAEQFVEKPSLEKAKAYVESGTFNWNSGMFVFHAGQFMEAVRRYKPEAYEGLSRIGVAWNTDRRDQTVEHVYPTLPKISVDYGVMEPASADPEIQVCTVTMGVWWTDVGSWPTYGDTLTADECGNRSSGRVVHLDSRDVLAVSEDPNHTITTIGCEKLIVVHTEDATLICPADQAERVKDMVGEMDDDLR